MLPGARVFTPASYQCISLFWSMHVAIAHNQKGTVQVSVAGHLPSDPRAVLPANTKHVSNVVTGNFAM
jgi:hypothetical protein